MRILQDISYILPPFSQFLCFASITCSQKLGSLLLESRKNRRSAERESSDVIAFAGLNFHRPHDSMDSWLLMCLESFLIAQVSSTANLLRVVHSLDTRSVGSPTGQA